MLVSKEDMLNKKEVLQIHMIIKKRKREIQRIINEGKIALFEIAHRSDQDKCFVLLMQILFEYFHL